MTGWPTDKRARAQAARLQKSHPRWLVIWSPWRRQFTAFGTIAPVRVIIDEVDPRLLADKMLVEELHYQRLGAAPY